eukprot:TRINITY_DN2566_c0_g1_i4.p1 TRINITY_DN2566_c0_g1~~TRINITY_DN2566_c0_g1_i4.p1  ORF type:complete len:340 (+),score=61.10 TRINITY_DN2566_c0_g1_i4:690-1709(+)
MLRGIKKHTSVFTSHSEVSQLEGIEKEMEENGLYSNLIICKSQLEKQRLESYDYIPSNIHVMDNWNADSYLDMVNEFSFNSEEHELDPSLKQKADSATVVILTDMDHTLLGDDEAIQELSQILKERDDIFFGVATGRDLHLAQQGLQDTPLRTPDLYIVSVGSQIFYDSNNEPDPLFSEAIGTNWDREKVEEILSAFPYMERQEETSQGLYKVSYNHSQDPEEQKLAQEHLQEIKLELKKTGLAFTMLYSGNMFLDVLPSVCCKGAAVRYLSYHLKIHPQRIYTFGDSGNDSTMLTGLLNGVIVSNHRDELSTFKSNNVTFSQHNNAWSIVDIIKKNTK